MLVAHFLCVMDLIASATDRLTARQSDAFISRCQRRASNKAEPDEVQALRRAFEVHQPSSLGSAADRSATHLTVHLTAIELELLARWATDALAAEEQRGRDPELPTADPLDMAVFEISSGWDEVGDIEVHPDTRATAHRLLTTADPGDLVAFDRCLDEALLERLCEAVEDLAIVLGTTDEAAQIAASLAPAWEGTWDGLLEAAPLLAGPSPATVTATTPSPPPC